MIARWSTVVQKFLMALSGFVLVVFVIFHLAGNLLLLSDDPSVFNLYSHKLVSLGGLLIAAEIGLLAAFLLHVVTAVVVTRKNRRARPEGYKTYRSAGRNSRKTLASSTMFWSGVVLLVFTALHLKTFKYGPGVAEGYVVNIDGEQVRDLYRLVAEVFSNVWYVIGYVASMLFLGFHVSHGFWSAFQSSGIYHRKLTPRLYLLGAILAMVLAIGYAILPIWMYFQGAA